MKNNERFQNRLRLCTAFFLVILFALLTSSCNAEKPKVYRVGILSGLDYMAGAVDGFKAGMAELGYVEGQNIVYDLQSTNFDIATYQRILQQFVANKVDLIFVFPTEASLEAKAATQGTDIPVLFSIANIEDTGLVDSLRKPGGNITGVRYPGPDIALKRFEIMRELVPQAKRMLVPYQRGYPIVASQLELLRPAAAAVGVTLIEAPVDNAAELQTFLDQRAASPDIGLDAILIIPEPLAVTPDAFLVLAKFAAEHQIPVGGAYAEVEGYKSVFGVNVDPPAVGKQAAFLADKILRGTPAGTIPVVSAESYFQINDSVAQELGLTVPEGLLAQANKVIH
ncbi:MAG: ABC transporter substrate-binding protein [Anaerolineae bacterium]|jgi:putative ABC transport system substrate-binding protein|nr:ABC transporter substrate-binding protein [Anaerolineae bacterium]MDH7474564.1 ABC transporter substrate-binding protein [Anaerolineae bacterium]